jgi:WXG100 family type VII secretion target
VSISDNEIYVNYPNVTNMEEALSAADSSINMVLNELYDAINPLQATWSGASAFEYGQLQTRWTNDVNSMQGLLTTYANTLNEMSVNYSSTDNNLAMQWGDIT